MDRDERVGEIGLLPPIERGVCIEYLQTAHQQHDQADEIRPMPQTSRQRMSFDHSCDRRTGHITGRVTIDRSFDRLRHDIDLETKASGKPDSAWLPDRNF